MGKRAIVLVWERELYGKRAMIHTTGGAMAMRNKLLSFRQSSAHARNGRIRDSFAFRSCVRITLGAHARGLL